MYVTGPSTIRGACRFARRLGRDRRGVSVIEFALVMPVLIVLGLYGTEIAYMAMVDMQVAHIATAVADNASRLGQTDNSAVVPSVTESMIDSVMSGALAEGEGINIATNGRIILSSLEYQTTTKRQYIHWQRCRGGLARTSNYGPAGTGLTGATLAGMGKTGHLVTAIANSAVMYTEVTYQHHGLFGSMFVGDPVFHHEAAYLIRDDRDLTGVTGSGSKSTC